MWMTVGGPVVSLGVRENNSVSTLPILAKTTLGEVAENFSAIFMS